MMAKPCYLPVTKIVLADGKEYSFRRLAPAVVEEYSWDPGDPDTKVALCVRQLISMSMAFDQEEGTGEELILNGALPMLPRFRGDDLATNIMRAIWG